MAALRSLVGGDHDAHKATQGLRYRYLTFDCYGTLIDWKEGIERAIASSIGTIPVRGKELLDAYLECERAEQVGYKKYSEVMRDALIKLGEKFGLEVEDEEATRFSASVPTWPAFSDTASSLRQFGRMGYRRYILSNVDDDLLIGTIARHGLELDGFVTAQQVHSYKPSAGHWMRFMEKTGAKEAEFLHVAQSVFHDIIPAERLGVDTAWVNRYREPAPTDAQPLYICQSLADLVGLLD